MTESVLIEERFRGPPQSGNGGYVSGAFAGLLHPDRTRAATVTLRSPIPLDRAMQVSKNEGGVVVNDGDTLIAEVGAAPDFDLDVPTLPTWDRVREAAPRTYSLGDGHNDLIPGRGFHPICFCCGADHEDGARVFAAPIAKGAVAAVWETSTSWADDNGRVLFNYLWTALDCPGQFAWLADGVRTGLLGRMTARIDEQPVAGEPLLVTAWTIGRERKKHFAGATISTESGEVIARAMTLWIGDRTAEKPLPESWL